MRLRSLTCALALLVAACSVETAPTTTPPPTTSSTVPIPIEASVVAGLAPLRIGGIPLAVSPDGRYLFVDRTPGGLCFLSLEGVPAPPVPAVPTDAPIVGLETVRCVAWPGPNVQRATWAPDSSAVAFTDGGEVKMDGEVSERESDVWTLDLDGRLANITDDGLVGARHILAAEGAAYAIDLFPAWSPDASQIAFARIEADGTSVMTVDRDGAGEPVELATGAALGAPLGYLPDGSHLLYSDTSASGGVWRVAAAGGAPELVVPAGDGDNWILAEISADGTGLLVFSPAGFNDPDVPSAWGLVDLPRGDLARIPVPEGATAGTVWTVTFAPGGVWYTYRTGLDETASSLVVIAGLDLAAPVPVWRSGDILGVPQPGLGATRTAWLAPNRLFATGLLGGGLILELAPENSLGA